jgi:tetratricopeptide (TPR) repeat protein
MKFLKLVLVGLLVLFPLGFTAVILLSPLPLRLTQSNESAREAMNSGDSKSESESLQAVLSYTPWRGDLWQRLGRLQLDDSKYPEAIKSFNEAKKTDQLTFEGSLWLADASISNNEPDEAKRILREITRSPEGDTFTMLQAALLQRKITDTYGAQITLLNAYTLDPLNGEINYQLGLQLSATQPDSAVKFLQTASELRVNRKNIADALVNTIVQPIGNENPAVRFIRIGQVLSNFEEWDVAQHAFQTVTIIEPGDATAWAMLAEAEQQNGLDGLDSLRKAINLAPEAEIVNGLTALYYRRQGKPELAIVYLNKALKANPSNAVWEIEIGNTLAGIGDLGSAVEHLQSAVKIAPQDWIPYRALAVFCITHNYEVKTVGLPAARHALVLNPRSPALMDLLGTGLMMIRDLDSAERFFLQADRIDPQQSAVLIHLGQLNILKGKKEVALDYFRQALNYARENRLREMAKRLLSENGSR